MRVIPPKPSPAKSGVRKVHVIISGRVQGVGFRAWTKSNARKRGLHGWVRNRSDKTVEAVFAGAKDKVEEMLAACKDGPLASRVLELQVKDWPKHVDEGFHQLETA